MSHAIERQEQPEAVAASSCERARRRVFVAAALLVPLALSFTLLGATSAFAISRDAVLVRAQSWVDSPVKYSRSKHHLGYRTDCSGYVSMCWKTGTSWSTSSFHAVTRRIKTSQLTPGDALLKKGYHIRLFYGWVDDAHTQYVAYEANTLVAVCRIHSIAEDLHAGYVPTRYKRITSSPKPANLLRNASFNVWARSWGGRPDQPVWWEASGPWWQSLVAHRKDVYRSARNSLQLLNPSDDLDTHTELSQSVPVVGGVDYRLSAWAKTACDPRGLELSLEYLDAAGESVAETSATGDRWNINSSAFKAMSVASTTPADAVRAVVTVRLASGVTTDTAGGVVPGSAVTLDDFSLVRP
jgi:hypothetical protein